MAQYKTGDMAALISGSMKMAVESVDGESVNCVWCVEGVIGRDTFHETLLRKWEERESGGRPSGGRPFNKDGRSFDDKPKGKPGWDGKPREKKFFRKD